MVCAVAWRRGRHDGESVRGGIWFLGWPAITIYIYVSNSKRPSAPDAPDAAKFIEHDETLRPPV